MLPIHLCRMRQAQMIGPADPVVVVALQYRDRMAMQKPDMERVRDDFVDQVPYVHALKTYRSSTH